MPEFTGQEKSKSKPNPTISDPRFSHGVIHTAKINKFLLKYSLI